MQFELDQIYAQVPGLCAFGLVPSHTSRRPIDVRQFELCLEFLSQCGKSRKINRRRSSYGLKRYVEEHFGQYVSNGAFIAAALYLNFAIEPDGPNACLNISERSLAFA